MKERLARDPLAVCRHLYPVGKVDGHEYRLGGTDGSAGKSMAVHLSGEKAGIWSDFATGEGGDLIDLWRASRGLTMTEAMDDIRAWLGVERPNFHKAGAATPKKKQYKAPEHTDGVKIMPGPNMQYLLDRGISEATIRKARVGFKGENVYFPAFEPGATKPSLVKKRNIKTGETKPTSKDQKPILMGWQAVDPNARDLWIVEGEPDWLAGLELGIPAVLSVPFGGGGKNKQGQWIENEYDNLDRFSTIYLALDMDEEGETAVTEIVNRLGAHRCVRVQMPHKDMNDCLKAGATGWQLFKCKQFDPEELKRPSDFRDEIMKALYPGPADGFQLPWAGFHDDLLWRLAELIVVNGINGHGKSQWLGHVLIDLMSRGNMACIYSGELKPGRLLARMVRQVNSERAIPLEDRAHTCVDWLDESLLVFDLTGTAKTQRLLEVFEYAYRRYGVTFFAIDSLMKCGIGVDDYNGQKRFVEQLADFKNKFNVTIFLVTHSRKVSDETEMSGKMDVKGDSSITDLPDTVVSVFRNKKKEAAAQEYRDNDMEVPPEVVQTPDALIHCVKQRNGEWEGKMGLWFDRYSLQYTDEHDTALFPYLPKGS
jgi:twinkle protein